VIRSVPRECWGLGGVVGSDRVSPLLIIEMMDGRPDEVKLALLRELSELAASILEIPVSSTRALLREFPATHWAIGGVPASVVRADEVAARTAAAAANG
jgi:4-oxalocrotonate tautomerase family enzyme